MSCPCIAPAGGHAYQIDQISAGLLVLLLFVLDAVGDPAEEPRDGTGLLPVVPVFFPEALELQLLDGQPFVLQALDLEPLEAESALSAFLFLFMPRDLEEERINRRRNHYRVGDVEQLFRREVDVPLVANAMGKVR